MTAITAFLATAQQAVTPDTVVTVVARDGLQTAADISLVVLGAFLVVLLLVLVVLILQLRKLNGTVRALGDKALARADPILERGKGVADNVEFVSAVVRSDVERVSETVRSLNGRLAQASEQMEERIDEFNALMEVVQDEAENIFIGTAATARGVKEGMRTLNGGSRRQLRSTRDAGQAAAPHEEDEVYLSAPAPPEEDEAPSAEGTAAGRPTGKRGGGTP